MDLKDLQQQLDRFMHEQNSRPVPEFEGYSPIEMHKILHFPFEAAGLLQFQKLSHRDYQKIPLLNLVKYLLHTIEKAGELKLTVKGFLPRKIVTELYEQGFFKEEFIEKGIVKLHRETDSMAVSLTRILMEMAGLIKKRKGKLSLTKAGIKIKTENHELLQLIFLTLATRFNWAYFDRYGENHIGQMGWAFSLVLLSKYGRERRRNFFYVEKYFAAFPKLLNKVEPTYGTIAEYSSSCYSIRTFDRFLDYFGLIKIEDQSKEGLLEKYITKTGLFDLLIKCKPPAVKT